MVNPERKTLEKPKKRAKSTAQRATKKKKIPALHLPREIITLCLGAVSIFIFFILFLYERPDLIGSWGVTFGESLKLYFGFSSFLMVPIFSSLAFLTWTSKFPPKILAGGLAFFIVLTMLVELFAHRGGILGKYGIDFISAYFGIYGTGLLLLTIAIINFIILTDIRLAKIFSFFNILSCLFLFFIKISLQGLRKVYSFFEWILYVEDEEEDEEIEEDFELDVEVGKEKKKKKNGFSTSFQEALLKEEKQYEEDKDIQEKIIEEEKQYEEDKDIQEKIEEPSFNEIDVFESLTIEDIEETFRVCELDGRRICELDIPPVSSCRAIEEDMVGSDIVPVSLISEKEIQPEYTFEEEQEEILTDTSEEQEEILTDTSEEQEETLTDTSEEQEITLPMDKTPEEAELELPPLSLLLDMEPQIKREPVEDRGNIAHLLEDTLASFGVKAKVVHQEIGPSITRYELQPAKGVRVSKVTSLADDIALALAALSVRLEAPIPGKSAIGIEIPNKNPESVYFGEILSSPEFQNSPSKLTIGFGKDITGKPVVGDLAKMPHLLIAGATGAGKSVCLNSIVASILFKARPNEVHFAMIDPKRVELSVYKTIPHLVSINKEHRVVVSPAEAAELLDNVVKEMDDRYRLLAENRVRNITEFNALDPVRIKFPLNMDEGEGGHLVGIGNKFPMPYIVVIIDELADLMMVAPGEVEKSICRLAQLARAVGIHLVVATQRPSVNVITGIIKANIPSRISFAVSSQIDSRTILDMVGAEKLIGKGDMLYLPAGVLKPQRVQGAYISLEATEKVVDFWEKQSPPENLTDFTVDLEKKKDKVRDMEDLEDELLEEAIDIVLLSKSASVSQLQRALRVGHARAGRLIDIMEKLGIVGPWEGSKTRKILVTQNPLKSEIDDDEEDFE